MPQTPPTTRLGALIRAGRKAVGLAQAELGHRIGVPLSNVGQSISNYERGVLIPEADRMARIIAVCGIDPTEAWRLWGEAQIRDEQARAMYLAATSPATAEGADPGSSEPVQDAQEALTRAAEAAGDLAQRAEPPRRSRRAGGGRGGRAS